MNEQNKVKVRVFWGIYFVAMSISYTAHVYTHICTYIDNTHKIDAHAHTPSLSSVGNQFNQELNWNLYHLCYCEIWWPVSLCWWQFRTLSSSVLLLVPNPSWLVAAERLLQKDICGLAGTLAGNGLTLEKSLITGADLFMVEIAPPQPPLLSETFPILTCSFLWKLWYLLSHLESCNI